MLAYGFTKNRQFGVKIDRNSVFLSREWHITDWLFITFPCMSFYGFWKNSNFRLKSIGVSLKFYQNRHFGGKNSPKLNIS
jgi:hypothetical protein